ncbi:hypothetical protein BDN71DRAFT_644940 [Pleurotus eryngii]|uniref:Uncharacterized protein n=1 Tax=Pleurotus eryngii TaxID=5323 RepID=A0A9P6DHB0_PLEER|nr:hypothetical protein BDN71DRAFT_644940 [Pleurotus eryngii]
MCSKNPPHLRCRRRVVPRHLQLPSILYLSRMRGNMALVICHASVYASSSKLSDARRLVTFNSHISSGCGVAVVVAILGNLVDTSVPHERHATHLTRKEYNRIIQQISNLSRSSPCEYRAELEPTFDPLATPFDPLIPMLTIPRGS